MQNKHISKRNRREGKEESSGSQSNRASLAHADWRSFLIPVRPFHDYYLPFHLLSPEVVLIAHFFIPMEAIQLLMTALPMTHIAQSSLGPFYYKREGLFSKVRFVAFLIGTIS